MSFKKNCKNTMINIANHWGPDKSATVVLGTALGALFGAFMTVILVDSKPLDFIESNENNKEEN